MDVIEAPRPAWKPSCMASISATAFSLESARVPWFAQEVNGFRFDFFDSRVRSVMGKEFVVPPDSSLDGSRVPLGTQRRLPMSKLFSSGPAKSEPTTVPPSRKKSPMDYFPGKGLGSYHCFGPTEDKRKKLFRSAVLQYGSLAALPNADEALASVLPRGFVDEASKQGWTLREVMQEAQMHYASLPASTKPKRDSVDFDTRRLAGILASLSPNDPPESLLSELKGLIETKGEAALKHLTRVAEEAGRDHEGFIYRRRVARS